jgi:hypothetical protein
MATWLTHLRVADAVSRNFNIQNKTLYFAGSIAPDTDISPDITHWCVHGDKTTCGIDGFYNKYLSVSDAVDWDFYLGYYVHLLTDVMWHTQKIKPITHCSVNYIKKIKDDWKSADNIFLSSNREYSPITYLMGSSELDKSWFDYYPVNKLKQMTDYIINFSANAIVCTGNLNLDFENEILRFINESSNYICCENKK